MRILRVAVTAVFIVTAALFVIFYFGEKLNTDNTIPVITVESDLLEVSLDATKEDFLQGVTAYDEKDKDITDKIIVESVSKFLDDGICKVTYAVCDSNNNVANATRKICYKDYVSPRFSMNSSTCYSLYESINISDVVKAYDCIDGDISRSIIITSEDYTKSVAGVFSIEISVTNSKGDSSVLTIPLIVEDRPLSAPKVELSEYLIYAKKGESYDFAELIEAATDNWGVSVRDSVRIESNVDFNTEGTYSVHYYVTDSRGVQGHTVLTVVVG